MPQETALIPKGPVAGTFPIHHVALPTLGEFAKIGQSIENLKVTMDGRIKREKLTPLMGSIPLSIGIAVLLVVLTVVAVRTFYSFPFDPPLSSFQRFAGIVAAVFCFTGLRLLLLGKAFAWRITGIHVMAAGSILILVVIGTDWIAWLVAGIGWATFLGMTLWGIFLFGPWRTRRTKGHGEVRGR